MAWFLIALTISLASGFFLIELLLPQQIRGGARTWTRLSLAIGLGLGISSIIHFLNLLLIGPSPRNLIISDLLLLALLVTAFVYAKRPKHAFNGLNETNSARPFKLQSILSIGFFCVLALGVVSFISLVLHLPHGRWDAWVLWNTRARILYGAGDQWRDAFSGLFLDLSRSPDYPLLLPLNVARGWKYVGNETVLVPIAIAFLFAVAIAVITYSSLAILRSKSQGLLAGLVLLGTPYFVRQSAALEADIPLSFFFVATLALLLLHERSTIGQAGLLIMAGLTAGMAAWTKNEGLLFAFIVMLSRLVIYARARGLNESFRQTLSFAAGLAPILMVLLYFKLNVAPSGAMISSLDWFATLSRVTDPSRYLEIARAALTYLYGFGDWFIHPLILLVLYPICLGVKVAKNEVPGAVTFIFVVSLMFAGYLFTYLITPYQLDWHLHTSLKRLILQFWPSLILFYFYLVRTPDEIIAREETESEVRNLKGASNYV